MAPRKQPGAASASKAEPAATSGTETAAADAETVQSQPEAAPAPTQAAPTPAPPPQQRASQTEAAPSLESAAASGDAVARYQLALQQLEDQRYSDAAALMRRAAGKALTVFYRS